MDNYNRYLAIDLYSGCGGLSEGIRNAGFNVEIAIENNRDAILTYRLNHSKTKIIEKDIREVGSEEIKGILGKNPLHLIAGCPPCQGFSGLRKLNRNKTVRDNRNSLILEYLRLVRELKPFTIMMENVPGLTNYYLFHKFIKELKNYGYNPKYDVVDIKDYSVPQRRKRLVLVGSLLGDIDIAPSTGEKITVRDAIGNLESVETTEDPIHAIISKHTERIKKMISLIPKDGGSRLDLPDDYILNCHKNEGVGFNDIYGRLRWDDYSNTITGGCLNASKGRFLHPQENRTISAREAAILQSFPKDYKFPLDIKKDSLSLLIGNALPPKFSYLQSKNIKNHLDEHLG